MKERGWLQYIADIAYDRDGFRNAKDLGALVDELWGYALQGLAGDEPPIPDPSECTEINGVKT
jgi:hypothetical protein